jgi:hypothetical protein
MINGSQLIIIRISAEINDERLGMSEKTKICIC